MPVMLATQALADLARKEPTFVDQVLGIVSCFIIHRANTEADARIYAGLSGVTRKMLERMSLEQSTGTLGTFGAASATGVGYLEERDDYAINVGTFQNLARGQAVFIAKSPVARHVNPVKIVMENEAVADLKGDPPEDIDFKTHMKAASKVRATYPHPALIDPMRVSNGSDLNGGGDHAQPKRPGRPVLPGAAERHPEPAHAPEAVPGAGGVGVPAGAPVPILPTAPAAAKPAGAPMPNVNAPGTPPPTPAAPRPPAAPSEEWMMP